LTGRSWKEQFGHILIEAMASGVPVIGSNSGAIPEVIGDAGIVVPEGDATELRNAILRLVNDVSLVRRFREAGRQRVRDFYTHERIAERTAAFLHRAAIG
jgi:glycosyltransferase involved in cell wall biosynthesis